MLAEEALGHITTTPTKIQEQQVKKEATSYVFLCGAVGVGDSRLSRMGGGFHLRLAQDWPWKSWSVKDKSWPSKLQQKCHYNTKYICLNT